MKPLRLTPDQLRRLRTIYKKHRIENPYINADHLVCYTCGKPIEVGELYLSNPKGGGRRHSKFRHYGCAKKVGLVV